ncbi:hypothetical protein AB0F64_06680 [Streptomyces sp. NPDC026294]|uniref:hypothetical protein n=1 Tax=Streptomyces sp. NPDC026294 TaxID=3155362 RepID=UPI0033EF2071
MLRVHFTTQDLRRTRIAEGADPLWETVLSLHRLRESRTEPALAAWRQHAARHGPGPLRMLLPLVPPRGYFPDFLTPAAGSAGVEPGLEAVMTTPRRRLRGEIGLLAGQTYRPGHGQHAAPPSWMRSLADGEPAALRALARSLRTYHHTALGPGWPLIGQRVEADRTLRLHALRQDGAEAMLRTFGPEMRWRRPVLEVIYPRDGDLRLEGRGLLLVPSYFCTRPVTFVDTELPPVLVYPAAPPVRAAESGRAAQAGAGRAEGLRLRTYGSGALRGFQTRFGALTGTRCQGVYPGVRSDA